MDPEYPRRVYFLIFLPNAFTIGAIYWFHPPKYWDYRAFSDKFKFAVFCEFEHHGIPFSLPQRVTPTSLGSKDAPIEVHITGNGDR